MKNQTQKTAAASPKARRKSETLTLGPEAALVFKQVVSRFHGEELAIYQGKETRDAHSMAMLRRSLGNRLLALACEAVMEKGGSIHTGSVWWKLLLTQMSDEEMAARVAMIHADVYGVEEVTDEQEAAAIQKLKAGKSTARQSDHSEVAAGLAPAVRCVGCIEREDEKEKVLFGLDMLPHGWQRIQEMLAESPEVKIVFRIARGEKMPFTGWRFVTSQDATDDED